MNNRGQETIVSQQKNITLAGEDWVSQVHFRTLVPRQTRHVLNVTDQVVESFIGLINAFSTLKLTINDIDIFTC